MSRLVVALGADWRTRFRHAYRITPEGILRNATPGLDFVTHTLRPYTPAETETICATSGLDARDFDDPALRRAGVVAMAASVRLDHVRMTASPLRDLLAQRWAEAANDTRAREMRRAVWELMGAITLRDGTFALNREQLCSALGDRFRFAELRAQEGGPLRWDGDQVQPDLPAWSDVGAARALRTVIENRTATPIRQPLRASVLQALVDLSDRSELAGQVSAALRALRGRGFPEQGYLGPVMGTLSARLSTDAALIFQELSLQGPDQTKLRPVAQEVAILVEDALLEAMTATTEHLLSALRQMPPDTRSAYRGGYAGWTTARRWAGAQPLRSTAEEVVRNLLPPDGSWRYEDILDVAVTGATTRLMAGRANAFADALGRYPAATAEYLADVWDGINDGAWDQIDARSDDFVSALTLPARIRRPLAAHLCRMQRARLGRQDASGWRLVDCDLLLADFRSCRNVELIDFTGSNWWSAILPPPARYHHSRRTTTARFLDWCQSPPWTNPYFTGPWPTPFD